MFIDILFKLVLDLVLVGVAVVLATLIIAFVVIVIKSLIDAIRTAHEEHSSRK